MSWTVLIADDEPKIRRGLTQLLAAHGEEFTVVGEAEDGELALALVAERRPDVLLVDIRMPFVDGLDLIGRLVALDGGANRRVIVISGHDEFEYARKAVSLGVFEFLLKPVEEEVLLDVLRRAVSDLGALRRDSGYLARARELAAKNRATLVEGLFRDGLRGEVTADEWNETADFLGLKIEGLPQLALVVPQEGADQRPLGVLWALQRLAEECGPGLKNLVSTWDEGGLALLAGADEAEWDATFDRLERRAREVLGLTLSIERVEVPGFPAGLARVYEELQAHHRESSPHGNLATLALNILDRRFREVELGLDDVAQELQVSPGHLSRVLKQTTGTAFVDALARVRVRKASILLGDPSVKVYEVAERVGYASQHYFSRAFRRVLGIAPTEYRKGVTT